MGAQGSIFFRVGEHLPKIGFREMPILGVFKAKPVSRQKVRQIFIPQICNNLKQGKK